MAFSSVGIKAMNVIPGRGIISYISKLPTMIIEYDADKSKYTFTGEVLQIKDALCCIAARRDISYDKAIKIFGRIN
jgi:hypothetical protein